MANGEWKAGRQEDWKEKKGNRGFDDIVEGRNRVFREKIGFGITIFGRAMKIGCRLNAMRNGGQCPPYRVAGRS